MYQHYSSPTSYNDQQGYSYYQDKQYGPGGNHYSQAVPQANPGYGPQQPSSGYPMQQPALLSRHQSYPTPDPRLTAQQTNQTLTALASARRLSPEYMKDPHSLSSSSRDQGLRHRSNSYYDVQHPPGMQGNGDSSDPYGMRPANGQGYASTAPPVPSMSNTTPKTTDGHACNYCGKTFGRPSALKIHLAIHTGEKAFICPEAGCHRSFSVRSNMSRHIRNVHQIWPEGHEYAQDSGDDGE